MLKIITRKNTESKISQTVFGCVLKKQLKKNPTLTRVFQHDFFLGIFCIFSKQHRNTFQQMLLNILTFFGCTTPQFNLVEIFRLYFLDTGKCYDSSVTTLSSSDDISNCYRTKRIRNFTSCYEIFLRIVTHITWHHRNQANVYLMSIIETLEKGSIFMVNFEHVSHFFLVFLLLFWTGICLLGNYHEDKVFYYWKLVIAYP